MKLLKEYIDLLLVESRISDAKEKYPDVDIEELALLDPSKNNKYLMWMAKQVDNGADPDDISNEIISFHANQQRLGKRDIYSYNDPNDLKTTLKTITGLSNTQKRKVVKSGAGDIYSDNTVTVKYIATKEAAVQYGFDTRWCISMKNGSHFEEYTMKENVVFYFIFVNESKGDNNDKIAMTVYRDYDNTVEDIEYYDAADNLISHLPRYMNTGLITKAVMRHASSLPMTEASRFFAGDFDNDPVKKAKIADELLKDSTDHDNFVTNIIEVIDDPSHLSRLAEHPNPLVRLEVAYNKNSNFNAFIKLLHDKSYEIRTALTVNTAVPIEILEELLNDEDSRIRANAINKGHTLSWSVLHKLMNDNSQLVRAALAKHKNIPPDQAKLFVDDPNMNSRRWLALRQDLDDETYMKLARDKKFSVRYGLVVNKSVPHEVLELLKDDKVLSISHLAKERLKQA